MEYAPLYNDMAEGPEGGSAYWIHASDGVRLRVAHWPAGDKSGDKGTVYLYPGRTEFIEKYGRAACTLHALGYGVLTIDWRGQGLSDRLTDDAALGHVDEFADYQLDVAALNKVGDKLSLPKPRFLMAHSMGGCIGLRALHDGLAVRAAAFSGPMWGMSVAPALRPFVVPLTRLFKNIGKGNILMPSTDAQTYVEYAPFEDNMLTSNPDMYAYMQRQASAHPEMCLKGPSIQWVEGAFTETRVLQALPPPDIAVVTFLGGNERVVDPVPVQDIMARWSGGDLVMPPGSEHEIMMEKQATQDAFFAAADRLFTQNSG